MTPTRSARVTDVVSVSQMVYFRCPAPSSPCSHDSSRVARLDGEDVAPLYGDAMEEWTELAMER